MDSINVPLGLIFLAIGLILFPIGMHRANLKICPHCAEKIKIKALVCKYCGLNVSKNSKEEKHERN